jgi:hypothetical protein
MIGWIVATVVCLGLLGVMTYTLQKSMGISEGALISGREWKARWEAANRRANWYREKYRMQGGKDVYPDTPEHQHDWGPVTGEGCSPIEDVQYCKDPTCNERKVVFYDRR